MMLDLECRDVEKWRESISAYDQCVQESGNPKLLALDRYYREELPILLRERQPRSFITRDELAKVVEWKLARGKWRPRLLDFVKSLPEDEVKSASQKAFAVIPNLKEAVVHLSSLKGVGPATASAVLAIYAPDIAPFMSDEALLAVFGSAKDYSLKHYLDFAERLQCKAKELKVKEASNDGFKENQRLSVSNIERALYVASIEGKSKSSTKSSTRGKRGGTFSSNIEEKIISPTSKENNRKTKKVKSTNAR